jgi:HlyD family secretion protein
MSYENETQQTSWTAKLSPGYWLAPSRRKTALIGAGVVVAVLVGLMVFKPEKTPDYRTDPIRRTTLTTSITSTGTLQPLESVQVGSEVSGLVKTVLVDFNSQVKKGQVLATIDDSNFRNKVQQSEANLSAANAQLRVAQADYDRQRRLVAADLVTEKVAEDSAASRAQAAASVQTASATLATDRSNLVKTEIKAPIDGIVINRTIDPGNTVNASQSVPNLFIIANDLSKLKVRVLVDEADIGNVREGQKVKFTVDAFPDETFDGSVIVVRKQSITTSNVVSYEVMAQADNPGRKLLPGMTANVEIILEEHPDVLVASMAGARWRPIDVKAPANTGNGGGNRNNGGAGAANAAGFGGGNGGGAGGGGFGAGGRGAGGGPGGAAMIERINTELALDAKQKTEVQAIFDASRPKMQAAFQTGGGDDRQARQAALRKVNDQMFADIEKVLKPDQQLKFAALREELGARRGGPGGAPRAVPRTLYLLKDGKPTPVQVTTNANDGTYMQVSGPVKEGDLVIIGGGPVPKATRQSTTPAAGFGGPGGGFGGAPGGGFGGGAGGGRR